MVRENEIRENEVAVTTSEPSDALLHYIGRISTPWTSRMMTPRQGRHDGPICTITLFDPWAAALDGISDFEALEILYWLHPSRRDLIRQSPANDGTTHWHPSPACSPV